MVDRSLARWARLQAATRPELLCVGYFGSYARGDWGVGSDLDVVLVVSRDDAPFERRAAAWDLTRLPVPVDVLVYTVEEWARLAGAQRAPIPRETRWVYRRAEEEKRA